MASKDAATYNEARRLIRKAMAEHKGSFCWIRYVS